MHAHEIILIALSAVVAAAVFIFVRPIPQDERYHNFADGRTILGVPNFMNVVSNIFFVIAGAFGVAVTLFTERQGDLWLQLQYITFFTGVLLTGFGSAWYHLKPDNETLVWDRLPMTIAFAGFFCSILSELISPAAGTALLLPLLVIGVFSVLHWIWGERRGKGDLRLYALVQFLPMLLMPLILWLYEGRTYYKYHIAGLVGFYILAKVVEMSDGFIYSLAKVVSGHTLKHLFAALGVISIALFLRG